MDEDNFALMASLDLSAAFDIVNIDLLLEKLKIIGLPDDISQDSWSVNIIYLNYSEGIEIPDGIGKL